MDGGYLYSRGSGSFLDAAAALLTAVGPWY